jgi:hypothetical protein
MVQVTDLEHQASCGPCGASAGRQEEIPEYKRLMIEFVKVLDDVQTDDQMQLKLMILANCRKRCPRLVVPMTAVFMAAEHRQPLMIEMKAGNGYEGRDAPAATPENMQSVRMAAGYSQKGKADIMRTDNIKIFPCFAEHPPKPEKMEHKDRYYQEHGFFESEIILDSSGYLIDGYTSYLLAVRYGVSHVPVRYGRRQIIRAAHRPGGKLYAWELPGILTDRIKIGDRVPVQSGRCVRVVTVAALEEYGQQAAEPLRMALRKSGRVADTV